MQEFTFKMIDDNGTYCAVQYDGDEAEVTIPSTYNGQPVTILFDNLFRGHKEITSVTIPDTVSVIGGFVFDGCDNLRTLHLSPNVEEFWQYAFVRCGIEEIALPEKLKYVPPFAFKDCKNLQKVVCNDGLKEICSWAFEGCDQLTELQHGPNVSVSPRAFETMDKEFYKNN